MRLVLSALAAAFLCGASGAEEPVRQGALDLSGRWRTERHGAFVDIAACPDGSPCGVLAWPGPTASRDRSADVRNPDPALRARALIGAPIMWGLKPDAAGWVDGRLYNPDTGQTFRCALRAVSAQSIEVTGCLGPLCRRETWIRVVKT